MNLYLIVKKAEAYNSSRLFRETKSEKRNLFFQAKEAVH